MRNVFEELEDVPKIFCVIMILVGSVMSIYGAVSLGSPDDSNIGMLAVGMILVVIFGGICKKL